MPLPLNAGDNVYTAHLAQALAAAGASVTFMGLASPVSASLRPTEEFESGIEWSIAPGRPNPTVLALASSRPLIVHIAHDFETELTAEIARNFRGNLFRKAALRANARKTANAEHSLARAADIIVALTAEDAKSFARVSPLSAKLVLPPGYN